MLRNFIPFFILFLTALHSSAQFQFNSELKFMNPIQNQPDLGFEKKIQIHQKFLNQSREENNKKKECFANFYLYNDYDEVADYANAKKYLLGAELIALEQENIKWLAEVEYRKAVLSVDLYEEMDSSLIYFNKAIQYSASIKDSLLMAKTMEQMASLYGQFKDFAKAHKYYELAIPIINSKGVKHDYDYVYNNFGKLLGQEKKFEKAICYLDTAINLAILNKNKRKETAYKGNKAATLRQMGQYDESIVLLKDLVIVNEQNQWRSQKAGNLYNIILALKSKGDYKSACEYDLIFFELRDSLIGEEVKMKESELDAKYNSRKQALKLQKAKNMNERYIWIFLFISMASILLFIFWYRQRGIERNKSAENKNNLKVLTDLLSKKNLQIHNIEQELIRVKNGNLAINNEVEVDNDSEVQFDDELSDNKNELNFVNLSILTYDDWQSFKQYFDKAYPNYLVRLREAYPGLTESEERLFLFMKINIKSKEAAGILGISIDGVKKTRYRLRKKLGLPLESDIVSFVQNF